MKPPTKRTKKPRGAATNPERSLPPAPGERTRAAGLGSATRGEPVRPQLRRVGTRSPKLTLCGCCTPQPRRAAQPAPRHASRGEQRAPAGHRRANARFERNAPGTARGGCRRLADPPPIPRPAPPPGAVPPQPAVSRGRRQERRCPPSPPQPPAPRGDAAHPPAEGGSPAHLAPARGAPGGRTAAIPRSSEGRDGRHALAGGGGTGAPLALRLAAPRGCGCCCCCRYPPLLLPPLMVAATAGSPLPLPSFPVPCFRRARNRPAAGARPCPAAETALPPQSPPPLRALPPPLTSGEAAARPAQRARRQSSGGGWGPAVPGGRRPLGGRRLGRRASGGWAISAREPLARGGRSGDSRAVPHSAAAPPRAGSRRRVPRNENGAGRRAARAARGAAEAAWSGGVRLVPTGGSPARGRVLPSWECTPFRGRVSRGAGRGRAPRARCPRAGAPQQTFVPRGALLSETDNSRARWCLGYLCKY